MADEEFVAIIERQEKEIEDIRRKALILKRTIYETALWLEKKVDETANSGYSTHLNKPMMKKANELFATLGRL